MMETESQRDEHILSGQEDKFQEMAKRLAESNFYPNLSLNTSNLAMISISGDFARITP